MTAPRRKSRWLLRTLFSALSSLIVGGYIASGWLMLDGNDACMRFGISRGRLDIAFIEEESLPFTFGRANFTIDPNGYKPFFPSHWTFIAIVNAPNYELGHLYYEDDEPSYLHWYHINLLPLVLLVTALNVWWYRRDWRLGYGPGYCRKCGYDIRTTPNRCPECGAAPGDNWRMPGPNRLRPSWKFVLGLSLLLWFSSLLFTVTYFGRGVTLSFEAGFVAVYWGGDSVDRNTEVGNHFAPPWCSHGAGRDFSDGSLEVYGPDVGCLQWLEFLRDGSFNAIVFARGTGLWPPTLAWYLNGASYNAAVLPFWMPAALATIVLLRNRARRKGLCRNCNYDLRGSPDRCPECGHTAPIESPNPL